MEKKIDIAAILKDCPQGMELDCPLFDGLEFDHIDNDNLNYPVLCRVQCSYGGYNIHAFTKYGCFNSYEYSKCVIFPKGKKTWEEFVPPREFKAGDVLVSEAGNIVLFSHIDSENVVYFHCIIPTYSNLRIEETPKVGVGKYYECTLANEQQRQKMYDSIKRSGYKYNQNTNKLEKLIKPKFKVDDRIVNNGYIVVITDIFTDDQVYGYKSKMGGIGGILFTEQDEWELVPDKFDVTTLKPFDKVLVRDSIFGRWKIEFFEKFDKELKFPFICMNSRYSICIPYNGNEYLHDTILPCNDYYQI